MTISSITRKAGPYIGNGTASVFPFAFKVFQASDVEVVRLTVATNVETTLALTTDYTVSLNQDQDSNPGGSITLVAGALATGYNLVITSDVENLQPTDLTNQGGFYPDVINDALDRATIQIQQLQLGVDRSAKLPITSTEDANALVADIVRLADSADNLDIDANNIDAINTVATNITSVNTTASSIASVNTTAGSITNVNTTAANIANVNAVGSDLLEPVSEINTVAVNIDNVNTVGTNISNVNTVAGVSSNVTTVAGIAANVSTVAGVSSSVSIVAGIQDDVTTVAGVSSSVVIAATNVADIENFADVYQGAKTSNPTLRNDGSALQIGDLYFNTTENQMKVYSSVGWIDTGSSVNGTAERKVYVVGTPSGTYGGSTTVFPANYDVGYVDLYLNGVKMTAGTDYTASNGTSVTLAVAAIAGDIVDIIGYGSFALTPSYPFVTPQQYGAVGDGVTNDSAAIAAAIATGKEVYFGGANFVYLVNSGFTLNYGQAIHGFGATIKTTSAINVITMADNCRVTGLKFLGNNGSTSQNAIYIYGVSRTQVDGCQFKNFGGAGYHVQQIVGNHQGNTCFGNSFQGCNYGINIAERGEYTTITGCNVDTCTVGIRIIGGNTTVAGCVSSDCTTGLYIGRGSNDAHGSVTGCLINHSTQYAVKCDNPSVNDFRISDCEFYYGDIWMYRSTGMSFANCTFGSNPNFYFQGSIDTYFEACRFVTIPTINNDYLGEASKTHYIDTQQPSTSGQSPTDINGGFVQVQLAANGSAGAGISIIPFDTLVYNSVTNHLNYTYQSFWDGSAGSYQLQNLQLLKSPNKTFDCDIIAELSIGGAGVTIDYSKISVYLYNVSSNRVIFLTPEEVLNGTNGGTSWKRYTFAGRVSQSGPWRVVIDNQTGVTLTLWREQGAAVPFMLTATNF